MKVCKTTEVDVHTIWTEVFVTLSSFTGRVDKSTVAMYSKHVL